MDPQEIANLRFEYAGAELTALNKALVMLHALGMGPEVISREFGVEPPALEYLCWHTELNEAYSRFEIYSKENEADRLQRMTALAIDVKEQILRNPETPVNVRNAVSTEILDRVMGKPKQTFENLNANINVVGSIAELRKSISQQLSMLRVSPEELKRIEAEIAEN